MTLGPVDHVIVFALLVVFPLWGTWLHRRTEARMQRGESGARMAGYRTVMIVEWLTTAVIAAVWFFMDRSASDLGLGFPLTIRTAVGAGLVVAACVFLALQTVAVMRDESKVATVGKQMEPMRALLPETPVETRAFNALSVTAGICEEVIYRGFLMAYLAVFVNVWVALGVSSIVFGLGHAYQGLVGVAKTAGVGAVMAALYILTGSLWAPIVLHAAIDINSGDLARRVLAVR